MLPNETFAERDVHGEARTPPYHFIEAVPVPCKRAWRGCGAASPGQRYQAGPELLSLCTGFDVVISHRLPGTIWKSGSLSEDRIAGKTGHRIALVDGKLVLALDRDINSRPCRVEGRKIFQPAFPAPKWSIAGPIAKGRNAIKARPF
jgi:hypothetical protein